MFSNSVPEWLLEPPSPCASDHFQHRIDPKDILRAMITTEIRSGRLTPKRRKRIIQFASQLGLSPVQAGELVHACYDEIYDPSTDENGRDESLHLRIVSGDDNDPRAKLPSWKNGAYVAIAAGCVMLILFAFVWLSSA